MKRILLVEDEVDTAEMMQVLLESAGYEVMWAHNGKDGLQKLAEQTPDLIMTDVMMPFMGGDQMLAELKKSPEYSALPVIVLSAGVGAGVAKRFNATFVQKPIDITAVLALVAKLVGA